MSLFKTGMDAIQSIQEENERIAENRAKNYGLKMFFRPGDAKVLKFYMSAPITYYIHMFFNPATNRVEDTLVCTDPVNGCEVCHKLKHRPIQVGAIAARWLDGGVYVSDDGKEHDNTQNVWIWKDINQSILQQMALIVKKYSDKKQKFQDYAWEVTRIKDNNKSKTYSFLPSAYEPSEEEAAIDAQNMAEKMPDWESIICAPSTVELARVLKAQSDMSQFNRPKKGSASDAPVVKSFGSVNYGKAATGKSIVEELEDDDIMPSANPAEAYM